jgi:hypothetical protein
MEHTNSTFEFVIEATHENSHLVINLRNEIHNNDENISETILNLLSEITDIINTEELDLQISNTINLKPSEFKEVDKKYTSETCSICLENFKEDDSVYKLKCDHVYHKTCLDTWFKIKNNCPMCKKNIN